MTQNLAQCLIYQSGWPLAPQRVTKPALKHTEGGFHVAALVVLPQVLFTLELEVVKHLLNRPAVLAFVLRLNAINGVPL